MKIFKLFLLILISLTFSNQVFSEDKILESLKEGGKIIFIRHAYAPGGGDPENTKDIMINKNNLNIFI